MPRRFGKEMLTFCSCIFEGYGKCRKNTIWNHEKRAVPDKILYKFNKVEWLVFLTAEGISDIVNMIICDYMEGVK